MVSGKNLTVPPNVRLAQPVPGHVVWERGGSRSAAAIYEQIRVDAEQIRAVRGLHEHIRHFMIQVTASASKWGNTAGRMTTNLNFVVKSY